MSPGRPAPPPGGSSYPGQVTAPATAGGAGGSSGRPIPYRILHLSDLHTATQASRVGVNDWRARLSRGGDLSLRPTSHDPMCLQAAANLAWRLADRPGRIHMMLVTGDLATTGSAEDLRTAWDFVGPLVPETVAPPDAADPPAARTRGTVAALRVRKRLLPGNHDRYGPCASRREWLRVMRGEVPLYPPGDDTFDQIFGSRWGVRRGAMNLGTLRIKEEVANAPAAPPLAVIGADLSLPAGDLGRYPAVPRMGYLGQGRADAAILEALEEQTLAVWRTASDAGVVWAVHFPPRFPANKPALELLGDYGLLERARRLGVRHLFTGHTHVAKRYVADGVVVHCAGSATAYGPEENTLLVHNLTVSRARVVTVASTQYKYLAPRSSFRPSRVLSPI